MFIDELNSSSKVAKAIFFVKSALQSPIEMSNVGETHGFLVRYFFDHQTPISCYVFSDTNNINIIFTPINTWTNLHLLNSHKEFLFLDSSIQTHSNLLHSTSTIFDRIIQYLQLCNTYNKPIFIAGYGISGSASTILAERVLHDIGSSIIQLVTIGQPSVLSTTSLESDSYLRVLHLKDYFNVSLDMLFPDLGKTMIITPSLSLEQESLNCIHCHAIHTYISSLQSLF